MPGAFKLHHLHPVKPIVFPKFSNFFTFILEGPIIIAPERKGRIREVKICFCTECGKNVILRLRDVFIVLIAL